MAAVGRFVDLGVTHQSSPLAQKRGLKSCPDIKKDTFFKECDYEYAVMLVKLKKLDALVPEGLDGGVEQGLKTEFETLKKTLENPVDGKDTESKIKSLNKTREQFSKLVNKVAHQVELSNADRHVPLGFKITNVVEAQEEEFDELGKQLGSLSLELAGIEKAQGVSEAMTPEEAIKAPSVEGGLFVDRGESTSAGSVVEDVKKELEAQVSELQAKAEKLSKELMTFRSEMERVTGRQSTTAYTEEEWKEVLELEGEMGEILGENLVNKPDALCLDLTEEELKQCRDESFLNWHDVSVLHQRGSEPVTPLCFATVSDDLELFKFLFERVKELKGESLIVRGAASRQEKALYLLNDELRAIAKANCPKITQYVVDLLKAKEEQGKSKVQDEVLKKESIVTQIESKLTQLKEARPSVFTSYKKKGVGVDATENDTAEHYEVIETQDSTQAEEVERLLKQAKNDLAECKKSGKNLVLDSYSRFEVAKEATRSGNVEMVKCMLEMSPSLDSSRRQEVFMDAIRNDQAEVVKLLTSGEKPYCSVLNYTSSRNMETNYVTYPFEFAVRLNSKKVVQALIEVTGGKKSGRCVEMVNQPSYIEAPFYHRRCIAGDRKAHLLPIFPLTQASTSSMVKLLIEAGADSRTIISDASKPFVRSEVIKTSFGEESLKHESNWKDACLEPVNQIYVERVLKVDGELKAKLESAESKVKGKTEQKEKIEGLYKQKTTAESQPKGEESVSELEEKELHEQLKKAQVEDCEREIEVARKELEALQQLIDSKAKEMELDQLVHQMSGNKKLMEEEAKNAFLFYRSIARGDERLAKKLVERGISDITKPVIFRDPSNGTYSMIMPVHAAINAKMPGLIRVILAKSQEGEVSHLVANQPSCFAEQKNYNSTMPVVSAITPLNKANRACKDVAGDLVKAGACEPIANVQLWY